MEKKPRKKKVVSVELENKVDQTEVQNKVTIEQISLDPNKEYTFVSNGKFHALPKGSVWQMLGSKAEVLINKGYGKLK